MFSSINVALDAPADVLIVDDTPANLQVLSAHLSAVGHQIRALPRGDMVAAAVAKRRPDIILLDIMMPQMSGYEVADILQANPETADIPLVFISGLGDTSAKLQAFARGGVDYIVKPFERDEVLARVRIHVELARAKQQLQLKLAEVERLNSQLHRTNAALLTESTTDALTQLGNRRYFDDMLEREWQPAVAGGASLCLVLTDIDHFKQVNDRFGHALGDDVLRQVGRLLEQSTRDNDVVCRYGGEEFAILLIDTPLERAAVIAERIRQAVSEFSWHTLQADLAVTMSFGVASTLDVVRDDLLSARQNNQSDQHDKQNDDVDEAHTSTRPEALIERADSLLYRAKRSGRNQVCVSQGDA